MSPINSSEASTASDASSTPTRRSRSGSVASQTSERSSPKTRQATNNNNTQTHNSKLQRKSSSLPSETVEYLKAWMMSPEHIAHPYPTDQEKAKIMADTGIELKQLTNWFVNNRKRYWKPRVEARLQQQAQAQAVVAAAVVASNFQVVTPPSLDNSVHFSSPHNNTKSMSLGTVDVTQSPVSPLAAIVSAATSPVMPAQANPNNLSVVTAENLAAYLPAHSSDSPHTISEISSAASDAGSVDSSLTEAEDMPMNESVYHTVTEEPINGILTRTETVDVHILRPLGRDEPTIEDVTILTNVPSTRILRTFPSCGLTFRFSEDIAHDRKKVQSRRDAEIVRIKKHYLKVYLSEVKPEECFSRKRKAPTENQVSVVAEDIVTPRLKYRKSSPEIWRLVCQSAVHHLDESLPSLEEAACMFGYAMS